MPMNMIDLASECFERQEPQKGMIYMLSSIAVDVATLVELAQANQKFIDETMKEMANDARDGGIR